MTPMIILRGFVLLILAILAGLFFWYVSDYYGSQKGGFSGYDLCGGTTEADRRGHRGLSCPKENDLIKESGALDMRSAFFHFKF